ncbi:MAG: hypothetical protein IKD80_04570 [Selenomonadaceae bacterium]|nr:hypothetical protein [Selenomonadaceae bacterium]
MEFMELVEVNDEIVRYRYYPEQRSAKGEFGEVTYFRKTGERHFDKIAEIEGFGIEYAVHACSAIRRLDQNGGHFPKNGINGWH